MSPAVPPALRVQGLRKKFCRSLRHSLFYGVTDILREMISFPPDRSRLRNREFWALDGVDFELRRGETLGIIGSNGSGKSTLLRLLNGIYPPDEGRIEVNGRIAALIAVGAGFHPHMTGRENIVLNGVLLGLSRQEITAVQDEIIAFADVAEFIDAPVSHYSSGMRVRLGFSIAVHANPEILLVDEVLAVGDMKFTNRAYQKLLEVNEHASTIVISHNLAQISVLCDRVIWLEKGRVRTSGTPSEVIPLYSNEQLTELVQSEQDNILDERVGYDGQIIIERVELLNVAGQALQTLAPGDGLRVRCHYRSHAAVGTPYFQVDVSSPGKGLITSADMAVDDQPPKPITSPETSWVEVYFPQLPLAPGVYFLDVHIKPEDQLGRLFRLICAQTLTVGLPAADAPAVQNDPEAPFTGANWRLPSAERYYQGQSDGTLLLPHRWEYAHVIAD